ncbi:MAG: circularly permuted type 2 ATP-grasp protein, partial [Pseudomonadota bacterium]
MSNVSPLNETLSDFLNYQSQPGHFDEMHDAAGNQREHWSHVIKALEALGPEELQRRQQEIQNLLRENGVTYRPEGSPRDNEHPWQLDLLPYLITSEEWLGVERALLQRAELFRLILEDIYGPGNAIKKGLIPAELLYTNPGFLRACVGVPVPSERYQMPFYAADITRRPDGSWCVISDRTQAPAGNGYALENRMLISRVLPSLFREAHVHRLATFFRAMRHTLQDMSWRQGDDVRIVMLNPGANNESYFEHAYLANYLGYTLVEGGDLTVRDGKVRLKTLDRLQPVDVIMRRVEDHLCDPLSLDQNSLIGVAGLLQAARRQQVAIANPLGSGVIGNASLMTVLPELAKHFLGEELLMPSSESWWCGHPDSLKHVLSNLSTLVIKRLGPKNAAPAWQGQTMSTAQLNELR